MDAARIEEILRDVAGRVEGDWMLVGGALVALWLDADRRTEDVDLVSLRGLAEDRLALLDAADALGLPIETLNSAADWFVRRIAGWDLDARPLLVGSAARILRPSPTVLILTKLSRLSESDLGDCLAAIRWAASSQEPIDAHRVRQAIAALPAAGPELRGRREALLEAL